MRRERNQEERGGGKLQLKKKMVVNLGFSEKV